MFTSHALGRLVRRAGFSLAAFTCFGVSLASAADEPKPKEGEAPKKITYAEHVEPIFREHCYLCHSQDEATNDLALDSYGATIEGGAGGACVEPGDVGSSRLWALVSHAESPAMPPDSDKLPEEQLAMIKAWIEGGALENSGSTFKAKPKVELNVAAGAGKPEGPAAMPEQTSRQPVVYTARPGAATAMASSPWAPLLAVAGQQQILLMHSETGALLSVLPFPEGIAHVLKFSPSGEVLLAGGGLEGKSGRVVLFNVRTGERITEVGDELDVVLAADINDTHTLVALGGPKKMVRIFSVADGTQLYEMRKHTDWIYSIDFSPDGVLLATADRSGGIFVWEGGSDREFHNLATHKGGVTSVVFRADSNVLASASEDGTIKLWNMETGDELKSWSAHSGGVLAMDFGRDGRLVSGGRDRRVKIWDPNGKELKALDPFAEQVMEVAFTHDGSRVAAGDWTGEHRLAMAADGKLVARLVTNPPTLEMQAEASAKAAATAAAAAKKAADELAASTKSAESAATAAKTAATQLTSADAAAKKLTAEQAAAVKAAGEAKAKLAAAQEAAAAAQKALEEAQQALAASDKAAADKAAAVKKAAEAVPVAKAAAEKAAAAKAAADKALAEKKAAAKATSDAAAAAKAAADKAQAELKAWKEAATAGQTTSK